MNIVMGGQTCPPNFFITPFLKDYFDFVFRTAIAWRA